MKKLIATSVLAALTSLSAVADQPSFNFVEGGYSDFESDIVDADGLAIRGNAELTDNIFILAGYETLSADGYDLDANQISLGMGYKFALNDNTALYTQLSYSNYSYDSNVLDVDDDDGYEIGIGARSQISNQTQLYGELTHIDIDSFVTTELTLGLRQNFTKQFGAYVEARVDDAETDGVGIGLSYNF